METGLHLSMTNGSLPASGIRRSNFSFVVSQIGSWPSLTPIWHCLYIPGKSHILGRKKTIGGVPQNKTVPVPMPCALAKRIYKCT